MIHVEWIRFNHDPASASSDALNIRRDGTFEGFSNEPEWRRGMTTSSVAAYARAAIGQNTVTIQASFTNDNPQLRAVWVRTRDLRARPEPMGCRSLILYFLYGIIDGLLGGVNLLGTVPPMRLELTGSTVVALLPLSNSRLGSTGVRFGRTHWQWEWSEDGSSWHAMEEQSEHGIHHLLDIPGAPWTQMPFEAGNTQLPWASALAHVTGWAHLAADTVAAATRITERTHGLDSELFRYNCSDDQPRAAVYCCGVNAASDYDAFSLSEFLERLERRGDGLGPWLNCSDCACIVTTMANLVGCRLVQAEIRDERLIQRGADRTFAFPINDLLLIGNERWTNACGLSNFRYHEVAWEGTPGPEGLVYDAYARVDGDSDPRNPPREPLLATRYRFGNPGDQVYRDRLSPPSVSTPAGRAEARPETAGLRRIL